MSNQSLDQLIESLKTEGIAAAEKEAASIIEKARKEALEIKKSALLEQKQMRLQAEKDAKAIVDKGKLALKQAERDLKLRLQNDFLHHFEKVLEKEIQRAFSPGLIKDAIVQLIERVGTGVELKMPDSFVQELSHYILSQLQTTNNQIDIFTHELDSIFIKKTNEAWHYEISPQQISQLLREHLSEKWIQILKSNPKL